ncbi:hypothetical protein ACVWWN_008176 [Mycobacterium sp. URHB0021]
MVCFLGVNDEAGGEQSGPALMMLRPGVGALAKLSGSARLNPINASVPPRWCNRRPERNRTQQGDAADIDRDAGQVCVSMVPSAVLMALSRS